MYYPQLKRYWVLIAIFLMANTFFAQAPQDSLLNAIQQAAEDTHKVNLLIDLHSYYLDDNQTKAKENATEILNLSRKLDFPKGEFKGLVYLSLNLNHTAQYPKADSFVNTALQFAKQGKMLLWEAEAWKAKGSIYGSGWGKADSAFLFNQKSAGIYQQLGKEKEHALMTAKMGMMKHVLGEYDESLRLLQEALPVFEAKKDLAGLAMTYISIGNVYSVMKDHALAKEYYEKALENNAQQNKPFARAIILFNLGLTINNLEKPEDGFPYLREAFQLFDSLGNNAHAASTLAMIGYIFDNMNELDSAIYYYRKASLVQEELKSYESLAISWLNLGFSLMKKEEFDEAESFLLKVLNMEGVTLQNQTRLLAYQNLGATYLGMKKYKEAADYLGKAIELKDSTMGEQVKAEIAQAEVKYETQLKEAEIERQNLIIEQQESRQSFLITLAVLAGVLLVGGIIFYQNREKNLKKQAELENRVREAETESLREIDRMKSRFFANISHEFRTPLTLILGPVQQLLKQASSSEVIDHRKTKHSATLIQRNANRLLDLVNQLLDLSKLESGNMDLKLSRGDIIAFLKGIVFSFESLAEIKQIRFHTHFPNRTIETAFDQDKLEKVLTNLLSNAFKFTPEEGDISVEISMLKDASNNFLSIIIRDNGMGIPEEQLEHIFERFYQVEGNEIQGTGIGLALTHELIELQQGKITVSSEVGKGSVFTVLLPISEEVAEKRAIPFIEPESVASVIVDPESVASDSDGNTLLLVEDNSDVRAFIAGQLNEKYDLLQAENGKKGFQAACKHIPDLIITDVMMPVMDGNELTQKLKEDEKTSHIPVIMLTAKAGKESRIEGLETGADDYLIKPFDGEELLVRIKNLIEQRKKLRERFKKDITLKPKDIAITSADERFLKKLISIIEERIDDEMLSVEALASEVALSRSQLHRKLKALTDHSPSTFMRSIRLKRAKAMLEQKAAGIAEIAYLVGFSSPTYFSKCFKDEFGFSPNELKNQS